MAEDNPGVLVHPPLLYVGALLTGAVIDMILPASISGTLAAPALVLWAGIVFLVCGIALMTMAIRQFSKAGTNVPTNKPALHLVTTGAYKFTRNPIYVSLSCIYVGLALIWDNPWTLALVVPVLLVMRYGVIGREEKYLTDKFGEEYLAFMARTRRWL